MEGQMIGRSVHVLYTDRWVFDGEHYARKSSSSHQGKLVRDPSIWWKLGAKAQRRKHLVAVVVLDDLSDCPQRHGVII